MDALDPNSAILAEVKQAFEQFDRDGDGTITVRELEDVINSYGFLKLNASDLQEMLKESDEDGSGTIDFEEFIQLMAKKGIGWAKMHNMTPEERFKEAMRIRRQSSYQDQIEYFDISDRQLTEYIEAEAAKNNDRAAKNEFIGHSAKTYSPEALILKSKKRQVQELCNRLSGLCLFDIDDPAELDSTIEQLTTIKNRLLAIPQANRAVK